MRKRLPRESSLFSRGNEKISCNRSQLPSFFSAAAEIPSCIYVELTSESFKHFSHLTCYQVRILCFHYNHFSHEMSKRQMSTQEFIECQVICQTMDFTIFFIHSGSSVQGDNSAGDLT